MLEKEEIKKIIPQREPFLMIDEVESFEPGQSAVAYKNVSEEEYYFKGHFPENPIMQYFQWKKTKEKMRYLEE